MNHKLLLIFFIWLLGVGNFVIFFSFASAQADTLKLRSDSSSQKINPSVVQTNIQDSTEFKTKKIPMLALGLSAVIPGSGQIYTENYWKPAIIWGVGGYWIYEWIQMNNKYKSFRTMFQQTQGDQYKRLRDFYRDERDKFAWFLGALYALNLLDAYAGAHLYDFDVSPDLTLDGRVTPKFCATIRINF